MVNTARHPAHNLLINTLFIVFIGLSCSAHAFDKGQMRLIGDRKSQMISIQIARTQEDREQGLMNRDTVAPYQGMLFDFGKEQQVTMWMKDTKIPLDMIFYDNQHEVKYLYQGTKPFSETWIPAPTPVHYVLELPAGDVKKYGIRIGDKFELK